MVQPFDINKETPSQTAGPYLHIGCVPASAGLPGYAVDPGARLKTGPVLGQEITLCLTIFDGNTDPVTDALVEIWQADANGHFRSGLGGAERADPNFTGWGRAVCDASGTVRFQTVKPGPVVTFDGQAQAPHVSVWIAARGINIGLHTRVYFGDEAALNAADPVLSTVPPARRETLLARAGAAGTYDMHIHLQGTEETVFLDV